MNYLEITPCDIANGQGVRTVLWISGCSLNCPGCHTPWTHDPCGGAPFDTDAKKELYDALSKPYVRGLTLSGGHPLESYNLMDVYLLLVDIKKNFPNKDIWLYTGLTLSMRDFSFVRGLTQQDQNHNLKNSILQLCDVVVDGPFIQELRDITLAFRGSQNQRIIDIEKTLLTGEIVLWANN